ncbi:MAG TPA: hypothetical protein VGJ81_15990 [Thermoanaerobaculia bacterium]|jgi:hypothetical protein
MAKALEMWPMHVIEEALGEDADGILPRAIRSAELRVRLPRHHIEMLEYRADQQETTVSGVLSRELDGIASAHLEELSAALPGFAEAMAWPGALGNRKTPLAATLLLARLRHVRYLSTSGAACVAKAPNV